MCSSSVSGLSIFIALTSSVDLTSSPQRGKAIIPLGGGGGGGGGAIYICPSIHWVRSWDYLTNVFYCQTKIDTGIQYNELWWSIFTHAIYGGA